MMEATASDVMNLFGIGFWVTAVVVWIIGRMKLRDLSREDFRWEVDMYRAGQDIKYRTLVAFSWLSVVGTALVSAAHFV